MAVIGWRTADSMSAPLWASEQRFRHPKSAIRHPAHR